jgi:hypothetical protein
MAAQLAASQEELSFSGLGSYKLPKSRELLGSSPWRSAFSVPGDGMWYPWWKN